MTPFKEDCLRKGDLLRNPDTSPLGLARKRAYDYEVRLRERLAAGEVVKVKHGELIPKGRRVKLSDPTGGQDAKTGLDPEIIRIALDIRAIRKCWDGENFILSHKSNFRLRAGLSAGWDEGDYIMPTLKLDGRVIHTKPPGRHDHLVAVMRKFPDQITATEGYDLLERRVGGHALPVRPHIKSQPAGGESKPGKRLASRLNAPEERAHGYAVHAGKWD